MLQDERSPIHWEKGQYLVCDRECTEDNGRKKKEEEQEQELWSDNEEIEKNDQSTCVQSRVLYY